MPGITTGDRLTKLRALRERINHEIAAEELRVTTDGGRNRPPAPSDPNTRTPEQIAAALGVTSREIKGWAKSVGLIDEIRRGRLSLKIARAYAAHHASATPTSTPPGDTRP